jgi:hypothetical protein
MKQLLNKKSKSILIAFLLLLNQTAFCDVIETEDECHFVFQNDEALLDVCLELVKTKKSF